MAYIGTKPTIGNFQICDAISVVNGQAAYTMQVGSVNVIPQSANHMIVSLNGTIQKPNSSFTVSGSTITFASNLATGDVIDFIQILGDVLDLGVPSDSTCTTAKLADDAVTLAKMASGTDGNIISYDASGNPVAVATGNDGQVLTSTGAGSPPAFESLPASSGRILQILGASDTSERSTTSTSFGTNSNTLEIDITPASTGSKFFITVATNALNTTDGATGHYTIYRTISGGASSDLGNSNQGLVAIRNVENSGDARFPLSMAIHDEPNTTSEVKYQVHFRAGSGTAYLNSYTCRGRITVMEIGA